MLQVKFNRFEEELEAVNQAAAKYSQLLQGKVKRIPVVPESKRSSWAQYTIQVENRDMVQNRLKAGGVPAMVYYPRTMSRQTAFASLGQTPCPVASALCLEVLSLPIHPYISDQEIELVAALI